MNVVYRDFVIEYWCKPISIRDFDYDFVHIDYDGPEDSRKGHGKSIEDCKKQIDEMLSE